MRISSGNLRRFVMTWTPAALADRLLAAVFFFFRLMLSLRYRRLQRNLQLFNCRMRENHTIVAQQVIRMHLVAAYQLQPLNVASAQSQIAILVLRFFADRTFLTPFQRVKSFS